jgi:hypothetical protein
LAAAEQIADALSSLLGREVDVTPADGESFRVGLTVDSLDDALELVRRLRIRSAA